MNCKSSNGKIEMSGIVVQRVPLYCRSTQSVMYRLDVVVLGGMMTKCVEEWSTLVDGLKRLRTTFLVWFEGGASLDLLRSVELPRNMQLEPTGCWLGDGLYRIHDNFLVQGWEVLYEEGPPAPGKVPPNLTMLIHLLSCLRRDADLKDVVDAIKSDPIVQYNLLRYLTRSHLRFDYKFSTFEQAVMVLGYRTLEKWLSTFLVWSSVGHYTPELARVALTRGRQMELLAHEQGMEKDMLEIAYVTGVFSALPLILGVPLEAVLRPFSANDVIVNALTERDGPLAPLVDYVRSTEGGPVSKVVQNLQEIGLSTREANQTLVDSMHFAEQQVTR